MRTNFRTCLFISDKNTGILGIEGYLEQRGFYELLENPTNRVLVHCSLGVNRSPSVVLLYFIKYRGMTLYKAYCYIAKKRRIFTNVDLFDILYEECKKLGCASSPLKLKTHHAHNFCEPTAYMFALYDNIILENLYNSNMEELTKCKICKIC